MIDRGAPSRPVKHSRKRKAAPHGRGRRTALILTVGAGAWAALTLLGFGGIWTTGLVAAGTGLWLAAAPRPKAPPRRTRAERPAAVTRKQAPPERQAPRLPALPGKKVISEDYNTLQRPAAPKVMEAPKREAVRPTGPVRVPARPLVVLPEPKAVRPVAPVAVAPVLPAPVAVAPVLPAPVAVAPAPVAPAPAPEPPAPEAPAPEAPAPEPPAPVALMAPAPEPPAPEPPAPEVFTEADLGTADLPTEDAFPVLTPEIFSPVAPAPGPAPGSYQLPSAAMLPKPAPQPQTGEDEHIERAILLEQTLKTFGVEAKVIDFAYGPAVTRYELAPGPGVRVNKFTQLADDLALALAAEDIRVEAPIPGKSAVGIEVPNKHRLAVPLREVLESPQFRSHPSKLTVAFGKDNAGQPVVGDLAKMPHLLIAGSTGSGKSVCMNTIICSLLFKARPDEVKMLMIDPKMVELSTYNHIPHLIAPVITDVKKAAGFLKGAVKEMESRYELFAALGVRNVEQYNRLAAADPGPDPEHPRRPLPYIVIFIDELADLMMVAPMDVEDAICRLAQMARACGMHLVIATQSPRVDVITGLIKANVPSRIAFAVSSQIDSRVILDSAGAERLLGRGDMLYHPSGLPKPVRAQGAFIDEASVDELVRFVKAQGRPTFSAQEVAVDVETKRRGATASTEEGPSSAADAIFPQAVRVVIEHGQASVSILQRRLRCNYSKAARLIDMMEERGFIGAHQGSRPRDVLISLAQWREEFATAEEEDSDEG